MSHSPPSTRTPSSSEFFARPLTRAESDASADRLQTDIQRDGQGFWAVEVKDGPPFVGFVGLREVRDPLAFAPAHEAGWRLAREYWGRGYATEAGTAALAFGFDQLGLEEIVAYAVAENVRSRRVMPGWACSTTAVRISTTGCGPAASRTGAMWCTENAVRRIESVSRAAALGLIAVAGAAGNRVATLPRP